MRGSGECHVEVKSDWRVTGSVALERAVSEVTGKSSVGPVSSVQSKRPGEALPAVACVSALLVASRHISVYERSHLIVVIFDFFFFNHKMGL